MEQVILFCAHPLCCFCSRGSRVLKLIFRLVDINLKNQINCAALNFYMLDQMGYIQNFKIVQVKGIACFTGTGAVGFTETLGANRDFKAL